MVCGRGTGVSSQAGFDVDSRPRRRARSRDGQAPAEVEGRLRHPKGGRGGVARAVGGSRCPPVRRAVDDDRRRVPRRVARGRAAPVASDELELFGPAPSWSSVQRAFDALGPAELRRLACARAAARDAAWKAGPVPTVTTRPWIWMPRSCAPRPAKKMRRRRTSAPTGTIRSPRCWPRPARSWPGCSGQATPEWSSSRLSRRYSLAASARSSTWPMPGLQGNRISSSQPASVKALMVSVTSVGVVSAPATISWAKSPRNP